MMLRRFDRARRASNAGEEMVIKPASHPGRIVNPALASPNFLSGHLVSAARPFPAARIAGTILRKSPGKGVSGTLLSERYANIISVDPPFVGESVAKIIKKARGARPPGLVVADEFNESGSPAPDPDPSRLDQEEAALEPGERDRPRHFGSLQPPRPNEPRQTQQRGIWLGWAPYVFPGASLLGLTRHVLGSAVVS